jgi:hypothetical protein
MFYSKDVEFGNLHDCDFPTSTSGQPPIHATVVFAQNKPGAIISIPPLSEPTTFLMRDHCFFTAQGRELVIADASARMRVLQAFQTNPDSVFVVETGPLGFVADYPIVAAVSG